MATDDHPFRIGPGGFLLDRNDDGFADDLALRIVFPVHVEVVAGDLVRSLLDIAARAGLETAGLPDRIAIVDGEPVPVDAIVVRVDSAESIAAIAAAGLTATAAEGLQTALTKPRLDDLADLFSTAGLLVDRDDDLLPDGTAVRVRLPEPCPAGIAMAAIELTARIGMESGGIDLPIGLVPGESCPDDSVLLDLTPFADSELPAGAGRISIDDGAVVVAGDALGVERLIRFLATTWPRIEDGAGVEAEIELVRQQLRDHAKATTAAGKVALLAAEQFAPGSRLTLMTEYPEELQIASAVLHDRGVTIESDPAIGVELHAEWSDDWELDRARDLFDQSVIPLLTAEPDVAFDVLIAISEPRDVRADFEAALRLRAEELGSPARIRVRSAYKLGLSWIREEVIPALSGRMIDRIEFRYRPVESGDENCLDLPIRWLQELYPGDELLARALGISIDAISFRSEPSLATTYDVVAYSNGNSIWRDAVAVFTRELAYVPIAVEPATVTASSGGIRVVRGAKTALEAACETDCDRFWHWFQGSVLPAINEHILRDSGGKPSVEQQPFFESVVVDVWISEPDEPLGVREELDSAGEALHEDIYFGALDWFEEFGKQQCGVAFGGPGAIVPLIHVRRGAPAARVMLRSRRRFVANVTERDGATRFAGQLDDLPRPALAVSSLTVDATGIAAMTLDSGLTGAEWRRCRDQMVNVSGLLGDVGIPVDIRGGDGTSVRVSLPLPKQALAGIEPAQEPIGDHRIVFERDLPPQLARLANRPGVTAYTADRSYRGRPMWVTELVAPMPTARWSRTKLALFKPTLLIVARHHANEVASTTAALLLGELLTTDPEWRALLDRVNVVMIPFENPDGAALHERLVQDNPTWKHHAARYNAVGLEFYHHLVDNTTPYGEARVRGAIWRRWLPDVVVDNHGVPSHEWTQHFSGFGSPPRFSQSFWMVQALLYGIMVHADQPEQAEWARKLTSRLASAIAADPEIGPADAEYADRYRRWGSERYPERFPSQLLDGFLCYLSSAAADAAGRNFGIRAPKTTTLDWVTEVPDETAHGSQLSRTARAQLLANRATIDLMTAGDLTVRREVIADEDGRRAIRLSRIRPLS